MLCTNSENIKVKNVQAKNISVIPLNVKAEKTSVNIKNGCFKDFLTVEKNISFVIFCYTYKIQKGNEIINIQSGLKNQELLYRSW